jgi:hypothetical protein
MTRTVLARNTFGRMKEMTLEEYTSRAVKDQRCMAYDAASEKVAQDLYDQQCAFAKDCFEQLYAEQNHNPTAA